MDDSIYYSPTFSRNRAAQGAPQRDRKSGEGRQDERGGERSHVIPAAVERMRSRSERLRSFTKWPLDPPVGPVDLAQAGLFYLGERDKVKCFSCGCVLHHWARGDNPLSEHRRISPLCPYLASLEQLPVSAPLKDPRMKDERNRLATFPGWPVSAPLGREELAEAGFHYTGSGDRVQCFSCLGSIHKWEQGDKAWNEHKRLFPDCDFVMGGETGNIPIKPHPHVIHKPPGRPVALSQQHEPWHNPPASNAGRVYNMDTLSSSLPSAYASSNDCYFENMRIASFQKPSWLSASAPVSVPLLAQAGFFYTGSGDTVQCFFCRCYVSNWKRGDSPFGEHKKLQPTCPFVRGDDTANIPVGLDITAGDMAKSGSMRSIAKRLASFSKWSSSSPVKEMELAEAGFYYTGKDDCVTCCCCGIMASDWRRGDQPVNEHKKYKRDCPYITTYFPDNSSTTGARLVAQANETEQPMEWVSSNGTIS